MKRILLVVVSFFMVTQLFAQVLSLDTILSIISKKNPEVKMYEAQHQAFKLYAQGANAWEAPQVSAGFFMTPYQPKLWKAETPNGGMTTNNVMGSFMIQGQQMIPNPAKLRANERYMQSMADVELSNLAWAQNELRLMAKMNYYEWGILKKKLLVLEEQEQLIKYLLKTTESRYVYASEKLGSIYKTKASLAELQSMRLMFEGEIHWKRANLNQYMNRDQATLFDIDTLLSFQNYEEDSTIPLQLLSDRSDIAAIDQNVTLLKYKQSYEKSKLKPDFGIQYAHMFAFGKNPNLFSIMGMVNIPLAPWSAKMYKASSLGLQAEIQAAQNQKEMLQNEAVSTLSSLKNRMKRQKQQLEIYEQTIVPALSKNYKISLLAYEQNTEELMTVLEALQAWQMSKTEILTKKLELLLLEATYEKTLEKK